MGPYFRWILQVLNFGMCSADLLERTDPGSEQIPEPLSVMQITLKNKLMIFGIKFFEEIINFYIFLCQLFYS